MDLLADARTVLDTLAPIEREVQTGSTWYLARIQPYRTMDNVIDGVVLTFNDVTERVQAIAARRARDLAEAIVDTVREPLVVLDRQLHIVTANRAYWSRFGGDPAGDVGHSLYQTGAGQWDFDTMHQWLDAMGSPERTIKTLELVHDFPALGQQNLKISLRRVSEKGGHTDLVLLSIQVL